jgi:transcriptional regulator with XRE-family HTH domain
MTKFSALLKKAREVDAYWEASAKHDFAVQLQQILKDQGLSQKKMAELAAVSASQISQVLAGSENLTLKAMLKYSLSVGYVVKVRLMKKSAAKACMPAGSAIEDNSWMRLLSHQRYPKTAHFNSAAWDSADCGAENEATFDMTPNAQARIAHAA